MAQIFLANDETEIYDALTVLTATCHEDSRNWWFDAEGNPVDRPKGDLIMLMVTELAEAYDDGVRKNIPDEKCPDFSALEVELADALIRIFDFAGGFDLDLAGALIAKRRYNQTRIDHTYEARAAEGGKKI